MTEKQIRLLKIFVKRSNIRYVRIVSYKVINALSYDKSGKIPAYQGMGNICSHIAGAVRDATKSRYLFMYEYLHRASLSTAFYIADALSTGISAVNLGLMLMKQLKSWVVG